VTGPVNQVFVPGTLAELFSAWARSPEAVPVAGGVDLLRTQQGRAFSLPQNILSLEKLDELRRISRSERYLEAGSMVTANQLLYLGKIVPDALARTLEGIAVPQLRNLITLGGMLCNRRRLDLCAPLAALDARCELRSGAQSRWISVSRLAAEERSRAPQELLTRIRIPLEEWNYTRCRKFLLPGELFSGCAVFIAKIEKDMLTDLRVVFSGGTMIRDREAVLAGKRLPLDPKAALHFAALWKEDLSSRNDLDPLLRDAFFCFIKTSVQELTD